MGAPLTLDGPGDQPGPRPTHPGVGRIVDTSATNGVTRGVTINVGLSASDAPALGRARPFALVVAVLKARAC